MPEHHWTLHGTSLSDPERLPGIGTCQVEVRDTPEQEENVKIDNAAFTYVPGR